MKKRLFLILALVLVSHAASAGCRWRMKCTAYGNDTHQKCLQYLTEYTNNSVCYHIRANNRLNGDDLISIGKRMKKDGR